ncbi:acetate--CoA ligase family protein [Bradyrhizobium sp. CCGB12]|uniref:acetate--CoA ligase family protein n=1 Tax=Bradyrhizobium sp. CCGB12 TaxID=2949632 RepID=UPI0035BEE3C5
MMLGATFDPQFGPVIAFGLDGIWVEALKDIRVLLPPFDEADIHAAIGQLRAASVLRGARGGAKADLDVWPIASLSSERSAEILPTRSI